MTNFYKFCTKIESVTRFSNLQYLFRPIYFNSIFVMSESDGLCICYNALLNLRGCDSCNLQAYLAMLETASIPPLLRRPYGPRILLPDLLCHSTLLSNPGYMPLSLPIFLIKFALRLGHRLIEHTVCVNHQLASGFPTTNRVEPGPIVSDSWRSNHCTHANYGVKLTQTTDVVFPIRRNPIRRN